MIAVDLCKQWALDVDPKAIKQIKFTANLDQGKNNDNQDINDDTVMFLITEDAEETILDFSQETGRVL